MQGRASVQSQGYGHNSKVQKSHAVSNTWVLSPAENPIESNLSFPLSVQEETLITIHMAQDIIGEIILVWSVPSYLCWLETPGRSVCCAGSRLLKDVACSEIWK